MKMKEKALKDNMDQFDLDICAMSKEIAELITKNQDLTKENDRLLKEHESFTQRIDQVNIGVYLWASNRLNCNILHPPAPSRARCSEGDRRGYACRAPCPEPGHSSRASTTADPGRVPASPYRIASPNRRTAHRCSCPLKGSPHDVRTPENPPGRIERTHARDIPRRSATD